MKTEGNRVTLTFNGSTLGLFHGDLPFAGVQRLQPPPSGGPRQYGRPSVAYIYKAGLKGFAPANDTKSSGAIHRRCGRSTTSAASPIRSLSTSPPVIVWKSSEVRHRFARLMPPPHKFFFARENEVNLGYVYYRKDSDTYFTLGVMQPERGEGYAPWGVSDEVWKRR